MKKWEIAKEVIVMHFKKRHFGKIPVKDTSATLNTSKNINCKFHILKLPPSGLISKNSDTHLEFCGCKTVISTLD